jgi:hypothetical protein
MSLYKFFKKHQRFKKKDEGLIKDFHFKSPSENTIFYPLPMDILDRTKFPYP